MGIKVVSVSAAHEELLAASIALGDRYTKTLGLMTPPAYTKMADDGGLLAAVEGDAVVGYALFGLPKRTPHVRLAHLCVAQEHRGKGIARLLVETIRAHHGQRFGIKAKCRRDYGLTGMWTKLGFIPRGEVKGRSKRGHVLDAWWLDFRHPSLFAEVDSDAQLTVAIDHGVFADLRGQAPSSEAAESQALEAGWMTDLVELVFTPQLFQDIRDVEDTAERGHQRAAAAGLRDINPDPETVALRSSQLLDAAVKAALDLPGQTELEQRLRYVAEAAAAGVHVLATHDPLLTRLADVAWNVSGVHIVAPADVALHVDELRQAQVYRPADLLGTEFRISEVAPGGEAELVAFFDQSSSDSGSDFASRLKGLEQDPLSWRRELIRDGDGHPVALYAWAVDGRALRISVLRTATHALEETLARQVLFTLKRAARSCGAHVVHITDPFTSTAARAAARDDGFLDHGAGQAALVVDVCGTAEAVTEAADAAARELGMKALALPAGLPAEVAGVVERSWWPAKVMDSELPSFIVPIEPVWSTELFNVPASLLPRRNELGISREHAYYRSPGHRGESVPARLLWYVSQGPSSQEGQMVIGCSRLEQVVVDTAEALFAQFEHLGVYGLGEIRRVANSASGTAMALRFSDTELFPKPVTYRRLLSLKEGLGLPLSVMSLTKIDNRLFEAVYQEGHRPT
ncbi:GNAT family N-acetyltransferase [Kitasatospora sp. RB6PN24]|uniref:GNAT family N-acetyltransferase n=1 Tax=Kitasatospora humi TaxID=2893891 RepID=UPI001E584077|nr:GNAT family N-acetyltransferase [Kitasatospora humi]MCC9309311.1 GNAT family N-acetyltransferase [Kitasatospora humi]